MDVCPIMSLSKSNDPSAVGDYWADRLNRPMDQMLRIFGVIVFNF